jgi:hypothetical protein
MSKPNTIALLAEVDKLKHSLEDGDIYGAMWVEARIQSMLVKDEFLAEHGKKLVTGDHPFDRRLVDRE